MKISPNLYGRMDGSKFWCFPCFPENSLLCVILRYTVYLFFIDNFCQNIKSLCEQDSMLRIHSKLDRNWQELSVCTEQYNNHIHMILTLDFCRLTWANLNPIRNILNSTKVQLHIGFLMHVWRTQSDRRIFFTEMHFYETFLRQICYLFRKGTNFEIK